MTRLHGPTPPHLSRRPPARVVARFVLLLLLLGAGFVAVRWTPLAKYAQPEHLVPLLSGLRQAWWSPLALLALFVVLCPLGVPATPMIVAGAAVFGVAWGTLWNFLGTFLGAAATFLLARSLGREFVEHVGGRRLRRAERILKRHGFWTLAGIRFLPIPFPLVNAAAAVTGIRLPVFLAASAIGLAPSLLIFTYFVSALVNAAEGGRLQAASQLLVAVALLAVLVSIPVFVRLRGRRRRLRDLRRRRQRRSPSRPDAVERTGA